jgi:hypothetical protein
MPSRSFDPGKSAALIDVEAGRVKRTSWPLPLRAFRPV